MVLAGIFIAILASGNGATRVSQCAWYVGSQALCSEELQCVMLQHTFMGFSWCLTMLRASRYFIAYSFDTTLGVAAAVGIHTLVVRLCSSRAALFPYIENYWCRCIAECGKYGAHDNLLLCTHTSENVEDVVYTSEFRPCKARNC